MRLSQRIEAIEGSRTARFIPLMAELRRQGRQVISLAIGEPEFDTPDPVIEATKLALDRQQTRYSEIPGLTALREALADRFDGCTVENTVIFNGSKQAGEHSIIWNASDIPSGVYFYRISTEENSITKRCTLLK